MRQLAGRFRGCRKSGVVWKGGDARPPMQVLGPWGVTPHAGPGTLGSYPPMVVPGSSDEFVAAPVMMVAFRLGTPAAQRRVAFSVMASRLVVIATRIWTFSSCAHTSFSFWRRMSFVFWKRRIQERGHISYKTGLLGVEKHMLYAGRGEVTYDRDSIFCFLSEHWLVFIALLIHHLYPIIQVAPLLVYVPSILFLKLGAHLRG